MAPTRTLTRTRPQTKAKKEYSSQKEVAGDDGLTVSERETAAYEYGESAGSRKLAPSVVAAYEKWRADKR